MDDSARRDPPGHRFTAGMEYVGHTDLAGDDILDLEERREVGAACDRESYGDDD